MKIINEALLDEFRTAQRCEWCGRPTPGGCDPHHVFARGRSDGFRLDIRTNLLALDRWCHDRAHRGKIARKQLLAVIAIRDGRPAEEIELEIIRLRWASKNSHLARNECVQPPWPVATEQYRPPSVLMNWRRHHGYDNE